MSLYPGRAPYWTVAPFWEVLVSLPSQQSRATLVGCCLPASRLAFPALCTQLMALDLGSVPSPSPYASIGTAFPLRPTREASFGIPLFLPQQPGGASPSERRGTTKAAGTDPEPQLLGQPPSTV